MDLHIHWCNFEQLDNLRLQSIWALRQQVFIIEQQSIYADIDGVDQRAWHLLLEQNNQLVGYARLLDDSIHDCYRFQRIVLSEQARGQGLGRILMEQLIEKARGAGQYKSLRLSAQVHLQNFYRQWKFVPQGAEYDDGGIMHIDMQRLQNQELGQ
ncbi:GNAT family N-acetyltransferase [Lacimicrobium alkaliphilum]|uniref:Acetyltransferase n=1 Tax=Lacimicrobium alkaliphilum TaxID=1526571 RepID=A0ABQ1RDU0_9ALTE|nr:GNAT family N-acetyltransferase [Lacimicrobium alkaliphilum]GGD67046.1 acetyltransferase [Lacimicrobium alkaliphilum]